MTHVPHARYDWRDGRSRYDGDAEGGGGHQPREDPASGSSSCPEADGKPPARDQQQRRPGRNSNPARVYPHHHHHHHHHHDLPAAADVARPVRDTMSSNTTVGNAGIAAADAGDDASGSVAEKLSRVPRSPPPSDASPHTAPRGWIALSGGVHGGKPCSVVAVAVSPPAPPPPRRPPPPVVDTSAASGGRNSCRGKGVADSSREGGVGNYVNSGMGYFGGEASDSTGSGGGDGGGRGSSGGVSGARRVCKVATASLEGGVRVWDAATGRLLGECRGGGETKGVGVSERWKQGDGGDGSKHDVDDGISCGRDGTTREEKVINLKP